MTVLYLSREGRPTPWRRDYTALCEKQQAAAPYLAPARSGVAASSSWRRDKALDACAWGCACCRGCCGRSLQPAARRAAHLCRDQPGGRACLRPRRPQRWCAATGARDAGCAWLGWRPPAPPPSEGAARAAAQGPAGLPLLRRPLQTLRSAPEPRRRRQRSEGGEAPLARRCNQLSH